LIVIPAIDLKDGRCVRLRQGILSEDTVFSEVPEEMAVKWFEAGAERLHLVDLNGAVEGRPVNGRVIERIVNSVPVPVELGGGIREMDALDAYFGLGIRYAILGTVALKNPSFVKQACKKYPGQIILGIDARKDRVAVEGWTEESDLTPLDLAKRFVSVGLSAVVYTDIQRDGMMTGPNVEGTAAFAREAKIPVIASGGISGIGDVEALLPLAEEGVIGMITGRALYDGSLDLRQAIGLARGGKS
jgi:phosphoribosylformimino-5-aminoimidazole carboxamide ribotide isomerase